MSLENLHTEHIQKKDISIFDEIEELNTKVEEVKEEVSEEYAEVQEQQKSEPTIESAPMEKSEEAAAEYVQDEIPQPNFVEPFPEPMKMQKCCSKSLNIRSGPSFQHTVVGTITDSTIYNIVDVKNGFGRIEDTDNWVCVEFLKEI